MVEDAGEAVMARMERIEMVVVAEVVMGRAMDMLRMVVVEVWRIMVVEEAVDASIVDQEVGVVVCREVEVVVIQIVDHHRGRNEEEREKNEECI